MIGMIFLKTGGMNFMSVKRLPHFEGCIACGQKNPFGLKIPFFFDEEKKTVFADIIFEKHFIGYDNIIHGGIITTVLDESMAWINIEITLRMALTKTIRVNFLKPVKVDIKYRVESYIKEKNDNKSLTYACLKDPEGHICAESEGEFILMSEPRSKKMKEGLTF